MTELTELTELLIDRYVYFFVLALLSIGLYGMFAMRNLAKKVIGVSIFTTAIYLFFIEGSVQEGATVPIIDPAYGTEAAAYVDPLPHLLILTALVVGVGISGVALALVVRIFHAHGTLDEDEVVARLSGAPLAGERAAAPLDHPGDGAEVDRP